MRGSKRSIVDWAADTRLSKCLAAWVASRRVLDRLAISLLVATTLLVAAYSWLRPDYNWDMLAYVATALEDRVTDPVELHDRTWDEIRKGALEGDLYRLQYGYPYNRHQWEHPVDFQSQLSMYRVKVAYIELLRVIEPIFGLDRGAMLLSILPAIAFGGLSLFWLWRENALQGAFFLVPMLVMADYLHMTTAVTPDMLAAVMAVGAIYLLSKERDILACLLLFAAVLVRPDTLILTLALTITAFLYAWRRLPLLITFIASFVVCMLIEKQAGHPGWWAHFYFSTVKIQNSMAGFQPDFSLMAFVRGYIRGVTVALLDNHWPVLLVFGAATWGLLVRFGKGQVGRYNALVFAMFIGMLGKFASFPLPDDRFYFVFIAGMSTLLIVMWKPRLDKTGARLKPAAM
ncbi:hypothetical protein GA830_16155 [Mesorhizobium sp. NBSH29]|uniref:hypothetical protein n=1 Tax=Mesorhizobium sp. NBSH29 TaxID=2654249 RepID=UPI00189676F9|nr:hypothetical protein [Mesorhizobium sp. NBSH29]QPC88112.1 hypothetical protein GA830_16155 [Mesorhizobium sp. NBSH29]